MYAYHASSRTIYSILRVFTLKNKKREERKNEKDKFGSSVKFEARFKQFYNFVISIEPFSLAPRSDNPRL